MIELLSKLASGIFVLVAIVTVSYLVLQRVDQFLKIKAIDDCGKVTRYEKTISDENARVIYPVLDLYDKCVNQKGY